jgi:hypothetical protein
LFQGINQSAIQKIREICDKNNIAVCVIAYIRSVYELLYSTYIQFVKESPITHSFGENISDLSFSKIVEYLKTYLDVFGENLVVLNYDFTKKNIYASFCGITGIDKRGFRQLKIKVNRSLTLQESEVLRRVNALHKGVFSTKISNFLIGLSPDLKTTVLYDEALVQKIRKDTRDDIRWINEQFKLTHPLVSDYYGGQEPADTVFPNRASYKPVFRWAMEYEPSDKLHADFASFLKEFAVFLVGISKKDSLALMSRAHKIQQEVRTDVAVEEEPLTSDKEIRVLKRYLKPKEKGYLPQYILNYFYDNRQMSAHRTALFASSFHAWLASFARQAVGNTLNPIEHTHTVLSRDSVTVGGKTSMSGFTIIEAEDIEAVICIAKMCPLLDIGGWIEVSHIVHLLGRVITPESNRS